jgi:hypothetical protein
MNISFTYFLAQKSKHNHDEETLNKFQKNIKELNDHVSHYDNGKFKVRIYQNLKKLLFIVFLFSKETKI